MTESVDNIFQIGEALEQRISHIESKLEDQINKILDLSRIGSVFTSLLDLNLILPMMMETALRIVKGEVGEVIIFDFYGQPKTVNWGLSSNIIQRLNTDRGIDIINHIKNTGESLVINNLDFQEEGIISTLAININSILAAPLKSQDEVVGVITIANKEEHQDFDTDDKFALELLGNFAAVAVANVKLHEDALAKQAMEHELNLAEQVQHTLMPDQIKIFDEIEVYSYHHQAGQVGGDFYDIIELSEGRYLIVCADVSNKGMSAALIMSAVRSYIRVVVENVNTVAELTSKVNDLLCRDMHNLGSMFVTMFICLIDMKEHKLYSVNAGHPPGYFFRNDKVEKLKTGGTFIGQFSGLKYLEKETPIKPGDKLVVFTDGVFECVNSKNEMLGLSNALQFLIEHNQVSWDIFLEDFKILLEEYSYDSGRVDDTTLLKIEIKK